MKRLVFLALALLVALAGWFWWKGFRKESPSAEKEPSEAKAAEESHLARDDQGHAVLKMSREIQEKMGLKVAKPGGAQLSPELKGYGRVLDPSSLLTLLTELTSAEASYLASSNELVRLKFLTEQSNASQRALQTAETVARRDQIAVASAKERMVLTWGQSISEQPDLPAWVQSMVAQRSVLVRVDLPMGKSLRAPPARTRVATLSGESAEAGYLGIAPTVDPQVLGEAVLLFLKTNTLELRPGAAVLGYLQLTEEKLNGVIIPRQAVVQSEGANWVYVMKAGGEAFTRVAVPLDHSTPEGWFLAQGITTNDNVVVTGAQTLLSEELKSSLQAD